MLSTVSEILLKRPLDNLCGHSAFRNSSIQFKDCPKFSPPLDLVAVQVQVLSVVIVVAMV